MADVPASGLVGRGVDAIVLAATGRGADGGADVGDSAGAAAGEDGVIPTADLAGVGGCAGLGNGADPLSDADVEGTAGLGAEDIPVLGEGEDDDDDGADTEAAGAGVGGLDNDDVATDGFTGAPPNGGVGRAGPVGGVF